ncbi:MAG TPA: FKBP-type peptidyl-prolyl cis-trans isomerase [Chryseolinea sp.]|nr:FKBP-type peptidyl-prolyl cis-trans isomerase [Chryseolinea sp.]HPH46345.1 FKBP-type peptidyl-prolyl cis-trans isomerase [Chryseolinea sp.]HPM30382.1 FKBP-type peptidyl-prolyl cis-trans isomerase [Chryseolinea sp.]
MKMMKITNVLIGLLLLCAACNNSEKKTPNGFTFNIIKAGDGVVPKPQEILVFNFTLRDSKDSVWADSYKEGMPAPIQIADSAAQTTENGMLQMFRMLSKGDSVRATMPIGKFFREIVRGAVPPGVDTTMDISYFIQVNEVMSLEKFQAYQVEMEKKKQASQKIKDQETIKKYLTDNNVVAQVDTSGLHYVLHSNKGGIKPTSTQCVEVKYAGKFMADGLIFDQSEKISYPLAQFVKGWQLGIALLGIGDSATFYIPSDLGYGPRGYPGAIPPNAILIFDVELLGIGTSYDQATQSCIK